MLATKGIFWLLGSHPAWIRKRERDRGRETVAVRGRDTVTQGNNNNGIIGAYS